MLDKFLRNKKAIVAISREIGIEFTVMEWENITNFCTILAPINDAIFAWWRQNQDKFPILLKLFKRFNSAPPGSHEVERLFSPAGYIDNDRRNLLLPETLEKLLFLNVNLVLYNFNYAL